jgi:SAM-dependent methyltransferase
MDLAIAIRIGSPRSSLELVRRTIESIQKNIGQCSYRFILSLDPKIPKEVREYIYQKKKEFPENFELLPEETVYWAEFINKAIDRARDCEFFIKSHDDIELQTPNFFPTVKKILSAVKEPYGWVSFDDTGYLKGYWSPPTRPGFYKDNIFGKGWVKRKMFQFHALPDGWWRAPWYKEWPYLIQQRIIRKIFPPFEVWSYPEKEMPEDFRELLDLPSLPVKCHAPFNKFVLIKTSVLQDIGPCENWQTYHALFVDEDWGLRALQKRYWNLWLSGIDCLHLRPPIGGDRSQYLIKKDKKRVAELFEKKWGFCLPPTRKQLEQIKEKHKDNYIPWSCDRNSYDWDYPEVDKSIIRRLHLGCGEVRLKSFINIDIRKTAATDRVLDVSRLDYPDDSIELIYASHVLEHFHRGRVPAVLREWCRVLEPGGKAVIVVPNFDRCVDWYSLRFPIRHISYILFKYILGFNKVRSGRVLTDNFIGDVMGGGADPNINYGYESYHHIIFNPESFEKLAREAGFRKIREIDLKKDKFPITEINPKKLHWASMAFVLYK